MQYLCLEPYIVRQGLTILVYLGLERFFLYNYITRAYVKRWGPRRKV